MTRNPFALRMRTLASALVVLAFTMSTQVASAQEDKKEIAVEASKPTMDSREKVETDTSPKDIFVVEKQSQSAKKLDQQIVQMKKLIDRAPKDNPQRAEFLFNLSELYWEKSKYYEQESFAKQDECFKLQDAGEEGKAKACTVSRKRMLDESKRLREESVQLYVDIIKNYPDFKNLDQVYYYLGANLMEVGKREEALDIFRRLIADYPKSKFVPNVLLAFGDYYFDQDDMASALKAYQRVRKYPNSSVYGYARYKEAWCHFNLEGKEKALDTFLETMKIAKKNPKMSTSSGLVKQTRKDIVLTYSFFGAPDKAIPFFKRIAEDKEEWLGMGERLAVLYADKGNPTDSTRLFRELIRLNKSSIKTIDYQKEIVRNTTTINSYSKEAVEELVRLMKLVQAADAGKFDDVDQKQWPKQKAQVETMIRAWSTTYHREAQKTKNPDLYAMAYFLYKFYLQTFQQTEKEYQMTFFYGELLYKLQKWEEAADAYERVLEIKPKGEYTNESAHGLVLSYFKIVSISEEQADLNKANEEMLASTEDSDDKKEGEKAKPKPPPTPKEIPELHKKLINACTLYSELNPDGDRIVDVKYTMARVYYDFNHLEEAITALKDIAYSHPEHRLAIIAANLHLDALNLLNKFDDLHAAVLEYLEKRPIKDEAFISDLQALNSSIRFKKCDVKQEEEKWVETAKCFVAYFRDFPQSELIDKALYNAALAFERQRELGKAIQVRIFLLKERPESPLAPRTLYMIGGNYHALAVYSEAAKFYELYAKTYEDQEDAEEALSNAATFRHGLGQLDKAVENFELYLENYGKRDPKRAAEVYFLIGEIYEQQGDQKKAFGQYMNYIKKFRGKGSPDHYMQAHVRVGLHYYKEGGRSNTKKAMAWFDKTLKAFNKFGKTDQEEMKIGRDAAAQAKFMFGKQAFEEMASITIDSPNEEKLKKALEKKTKAGKEAQEIFESVIEFGRPDWAIAALYQIGAGYQDFAENIRKSAIPSRLTYDQKEIYRGVLEDAAVKVEANAVDAYKKALGVALDKSWFNDYSKRAEIALAQLRPKEFRKPSELRAQPTHLADGFTRTAFILKAEEEDRLTDLNAPNAEVQPSEPTSQR